MEGFVNGPGRCADEAAQEYTWDTYVHNECVRAEQRRRGLRMWFSARPLRMLGRWLPRIRGYRRVIRRRQPPGDTHKPRGPPDDGLDNIRRRGAKGWQR